MSPVTPGKRRHNTSIMPVCFLPNSVTLSYICHLIIRHHVVSLLTPPYNKPQTTTDLKSTIFWDITFCWRRYVPPKRRLTFNGLHGVTSQKIDSKVKGKIAPLLN
jgi:hypothetical protein